MFSAGENGRVEGSVRLPLQGFTRVEDKQETGKNTRGNLILNYRDNVLYKILQKENDSLPILLSLYWPWGTT